MPPALGSPLEQVDSNGATAWSSSSVELERTRGPASPPYEQQHQQSQQPFHHHHPPHYQSQSTLHDQYHEGATGDHKATASHSILNTFAASVPLAPPMPTAAASHNDVDRAQNNVFARQAPRIAVTDPLADMRLRNLSKPEGLGINSDWPTREKVMAGHGARFQPEAPVNSYDGLPVRSETGVPIRPGLPRMDSEVSSDGGADDFAPDDFNWSDDEAVDEEARFEEELTQQRKVKIGHISLWAILRFLAVTFMGNLIISCLLIIPVLVIQFVYRPREAIDTADEARRDFIADNIQAWFIWAAFNLHISWWLHFLVDLVPRVGVITVTVVWGTANQRVKSYAEFYNAIKAYISPITYAAVSWASFAILFTSFFQLYSQDDPKTSRAGYLYRIYQVIEFIFFLTLTVCVEKICIKCIAMSFHKSAYAERIEQVTLGLKTFDRLKDYRPKWKDGRTTPRGLSNGRMTPISFQSAANSPTTPMAPLAPAGKKTHAKKRPQFGHASIDMTPDPSQSRPQTPMTPLSQTAEPKRSKAKNPARVLRTGASTIKTTASKASSIARIALTDPFSLLSSKATGVGTDVNSPLAAKRLAKNIFRSFRGHHRRNYLVPSDFEPAFPTVAEARTAFAVFDRDGNGDISQSEIKNTVLATYKERRFLSRSMQDVNHAVGQLERIFYVVVFVILMFEAFAIFDVNISKTLTTFYTLGIAFAFIFKESAQNIFDSIIFLFVTHPFDTGDRIAITVGTETMIMTVKRMSLLSSEFTLVDNTDMYVANAVLADLMIINYRRSGYQFEAAAMTIAFDTPLETLDKVEKDMLHWLSTEPERMFEPNTAIVPQKFEYMRSIHITVGMTHRRSWQDWGMRWYCRNAFVAALIYYMKKHGVRYTQPNMPIVYWTEDAATLPPSYEGGEQPSLDSHAPGAGALPSRHRGSDATDAGAFNNDDANYQDPSFEQSPPPSPGGDGADNAHPLATAAFAGKAKQPPKTFMGFSLPPDEIESAGMRRRKAKARNKGLTMQGGEG